jgi:putative protein-disulfide isomerase
MLVKTTLYYLYDPMCSWCWGYRPVWDALQKNLPAFINVEYIAGGLAPDSNSPMPFEQQQMIQNHWRSIESKLGTRFNYDFWQKNIPRRSTYNACRAAIAAHQQDCQKLMIDAIQRGYYLRAMNPSDLTVLIDLAEELSQKSNCRFNVKQFTVDIRSAETEQELNRQISLARSLSRQGFPSLVLEHDSKTYQIPIDYSDYQYTLTDVISKVSV